MTKGRYAEKRYRLYDLATGEFVTAGTSAEIGEVIGANKDAISKAWYNGRDTYKQYRIEKTPYNLMTGDDSVNNLATQLFRSPTQTSSGL